MVYFGLLHGRMILWYFYLWCSKSYVWSSLGLTALAFLTGALAFWLPTFLARAHVTQGLRPPCSGDNCDNTDRCSLTFDLLYFSCSAASVRPEVKLFYAPQFCLWRRDDCDRHSGRGSGHYLIQTLSGQVSTRGPCHLCSGHAGVGPLPLHHHFCGILKHSNHLRKKKTSVCFPLSESTSCFNWSYFYLCVAVVSKLYRFWPQQKLFISPKMRIGAQTA